jgi:hypothetical protein
VELLPDLRQNPGVADQLLLDGRRIDKVQLHYLKQ